MQVVVDAVCSVAFARVYASKMPVTAAELLYDRVLPFYKALGVPVQTDLTDNGPEYCGRAEPIPTTSCLPCTTSSIVEPRSGAADQRLRQAHEPYAAGRVLPGQGPNDLVHLTARNPA